MSSYSDWGFSDVRAGGDAESSSFSVTPPKTKPLNWRPSSRASGSKSRPSSSSSSNFVGSPETKDAPQSLWYTPVSRVVPPSSYARKRPDWKKERDDLYQTQRAQLQRKISTSAKRVGTLHKLPTSPRYPVKLDETFSRKITWKNPKQPAVRPGSRVSSQGGLAPLNVTPLL